MIPNYILEKLKKSSDSTLSESAKNTLTITKNLTDILCKECCLEQEITNQDQKEKQIKCKRCEFDIN